MGPRQFIPDSTDHQVSVTLNPEDEIYNVAKAKELERQREYDTLHDKVINRGIKKAVIYGGMGVAAHLGLTYSWARYAKHRLPFKVFIMMMIPTAAFFTETDVAAMELERDLAQKYSITSRITTIEKKYTFTGAGAKEWFKDNQFAAIGYGWAGIMIGSLMYNFSNPNITLQQKFINARMVSQTGALLGLVAVAALNIKREKNVEKDLHFEQAMKSIKKT